MSSLKPSSRATRSETRLRVSTRLRVASAPPVTRARRVGLGIPTARRSPTAWASWRTPLLTLIQGEVKPVAGHFPTRTRMRRQPQGTHTTIMCSPKPLSHQTEPVSLSREAPRTNLTFPLTGFRTFKGLRWGQGQNGSSYRRPSETRLGRLIKRAGQPCRELQCVLCDGLVRAID